MPLATTKIYTSPLQRCNMLAEFLSESTKLPIIIDDRIKELNFGDWEMKRWNDVDQPHLMKWMNNYETEPCPNGESYADLVTRVGDFIGNIKDQHEPVMVVTHGGVIKALHALVNKVSLRAAMDLKVGYGEIILMNVE
jgi:alpha-ribazole phosphatase